MIGRAAVIETWPPCMLIITDDEAADAAESLIEIVMMNMLATSCCSPYTLGSQLPKTMQIHTYCTVIEM